MRRIFILGSGGWGTAVAVMMSDKAQVTLWSAFPGEISALKTDRENKKLLPGVKIPEKVELTSDISGLAAADIAVIAVPSFAVREVCRKMAGTVNKDCIIVIISKGLEEGTQLRISQVVSSELPENKVATMSGPSHAEEVARGIPTVSVVSSEDGEAARFVQSVFMTDTYRLYTNDDVVGAELGGSLKNVIALAAGVCDGMGYGDNTKSALMTRGITEMVRLGQAMGARAQTFSGLTGFGDLIVTCTSMHSRNRRAGILIGEGKSVQEALEIVGMTVEGYKTAGAAYELSLKYGVDMPIITEIYKVLYENKEPRSAIYDLMTRSKKHEREELPY